MKIRIKLFWLFILFLFSCKGSPKNIEINFDYDNRRRIIIVDKDTCIENLQDLTTDTVLLSDFKQNPVEEISCYFVQKYNEPVLLESHCFNKIEIKDRSSESIKILLNYINREKGKWSNYFINNYERYWDDYLEETSVSYILGFHAQGECIRQRDLELLKDLKKLTKRLDKIYLPIYLKDPCSKKLRIRTIFEFDMKDHTIKIMNKWDVEFMNLSSM